MADPESAAPWQPACQPRSSDPCSQSHHQRVLISDYISFVWYWQAVALLVSDHAIKLIPPVLTRNRLSACTAGSIAEHNSHGLLNMGISPITPEECITDHYYLPDRDNAKTCPPMNFAFKTPVPGTEMGIIYS